MLLNRLPKIIFVLLAFIILTIDSKADNKRTSQARLLYNASRFDEAASLYQEIIADNPEDCQAYLNLAYLYKDLGEYGKAIEFLEKQIIKSKDIHLKKLLGRLYYLLAQPQIAIAHFRECLKTNPSDAQTLLYLGQCYEDLGDINEAKKNYLKALNLAPDNLLALIRLGDIYYQQGEFALAVGVFKTIKNLDPSITSVHSLLGRAFSNLSDYPSAYRAYAKALAIRPQDNKLRIALEMTKKKLGREFFKKEQEGIIQARKQKLKHISPFPPVEGMPKVLVGLAMIKDSLDFKCGSSFVIVDRETDKVIFSGEEETIYTLVFDKKTRCVQLRDDKETLKTIKSAFLIKKDAEEALLGFFDLDFGKGDFWAGKRNMQYRGQIQVDIKEEGMQIINLVTLEEYLYGVLPAEIPSDWPYPALCAQAIAARTLAVAGMRRHANEGFDFCATTHCQAYNGVGAETQNTNKAVEQTAGLILTYKDRPIDIYYSNNCGGHTQDNIFSREEKTYLKGKLDAVLSIGFPLSPLELEDWLNSQPKTFCNVVGERISNFRWVRRYQAEELQEILEENGIRLGRLLKVIPQRRANSGHLLSIKIEGKDATKIIEGQQNIRKSLGNLRSSAFKIEVRYDRNGLPLEFLFYGAGFGHGVGMCQTGAKGMALQGRDFREILQHYYPDTEVRKIY